MEAAQLAEELKGSALDYAALLDPQHERWSDLGGGSRAAIATLLRLGLEQNRPLLLAAMARFDNENLLQLLEALVSWSVRGLIVGGIGGGSTERAYANVATLIRSGAVRTTAGVKRSLGEILPGDKEFQSALENTTISRVQVAAYILLAVERELASVEHAALVDDEEMSRYRLEHVLPLRATSDDWNEFSDDEVKPLAKRLGNLVLVPRTRTVPRGADWGERRDMLRGLSIETTRWIGDLREWSPKSIRNRQHRLAVTALTVWPSF